jgi:hypothetical protein
VAAAPPRRRRRPPGQELPLARLTKTNDLKSVPLEPRLRGLVRGPPTEQLWRCIVTLRNKSPVVITAARELWANSVPWTALTPNIVVAAERT